MAQQQQQQQQQQQPPAARSINDSQESSSRLRACSIDSEKENKFDPPSAQLSSQLQQQQVRSLKDTCTQSLPDIQMQVEIINNEKISVKMSSPDVIVASRSPPPTEVKVVRSAPVLDESVVENGAPVEVVTSQSDSTEDDDVDDDDDVKRVDNVI